jgi:ABC-type polysaccharide transport system permease subunit
LILAEWLQFFYTINYPPRKKSAPITKSICNGLLKEKIGLIEDLKHNRSLYLFILPAFVAVLLFSYVPMAFLISVFFDYNPIRGFGKSSFVGLENFKTAFADKFFWQALKNNLYIKIWETVITYPVSVILALFLFETGRMNKKIAQTATIFPYFISWIVISAMFKNLLAPSGGLINEILVNVFHVKPIPFLTSGRYFRWVIILQDPWKFAGYWAVIYHSAMITIDTTLYEVAALDGAGRWRQMFYITLPCIRLTLITMFVLLTGYIVIGPFDQVFSQYSALVYDLGDIVETYAYRLGFGQFKYSLATAIGFVQAVMATAIVLVANFITNRIKMEGEKVI